jgi:hypothetical protein
LNNNKIILKAMKRSILMVLACVFILPFAARSQNEGIKAVSNPVPVEKQSMHTKITQEMALVQEQGTKGGAHSPSAISEKNDGMYLEPGWMPGKVMLNDRSVIDNILLRYDIYHQQIQFIRENDTLAFAKPEEAEYFIFDDRKFIYSDFQSNDIIGKRYFEVLSDGNCKLLLHRTVKYHLDPDAHSNLADDLYIRESEYYILKKGDIAKPVSAGRKSMLCAFKDKEEQVKEFIKDNNLKMNTCDQMQQVVEYYNSLP